MARIKKPPCTSTRARRKRQVEPRSVSFDPQSKFFQSIGNLKHRLRPRSMATSKRVMQREEAANYDTISEDEALVRPRPGKDRRKTNAPKKHVALGGRGSEQPEDEEEDVSVGDPGDAEQAGSDGETLTTPSAEEMRSSSAFGQKTRGGTAGDGSSTDGGRSRQQQARADSNRKSARDSVTATGNCLLIVC